MSFRRFNVIKLCSLILVISLFTIVQADDYEEGEKLYHKKDYKGALEKWKKAASKGHLEAMHDIGLLYQHGRGVKVDYGVALSWYRKAAEAGHLSSCLLYTSPSPRDRQKSRMPSSA